jgi:molecular chaperone GrpE (heat shock protein)
MDKRRVWREQEQQLVERWNAATERFRVAHEAAASPGGTSADGTETPAEERALKVEAARAELEAVRKQVARLKAEFSNGKRY